MKKIWLGVGVLIGIAFLGVAIYSIRLRSQTKTLSPEAKVAYDNSDLELTVFYCRPSKKGREIFGGLVPFGELWRTGANEATVFACNHDVLINGQRIESGRYQLITIPNPDHWTFILNSDLPGWGINTESGKVYHNLKTDVLVLDVPVIKQTIPTEQFTIAFEEDKESLLLSLVWDSTKVVIPIQRID